jgi:hypothetical protein
VIAFFFSIPRVCHYDFASLSLMWDEWHGLGGSATKDKPVPGGFGALEKNTKRNGENTWKEPN